MATFTVTIDTDGAAFEGWRGTGELARILHKTADQLRDGRDFSHFQTLLDYNGNSCGRAGWKNEDGSPYAHVAD